MEPYFQQPQLWVNTNKSTMIVLRRLCIIHRMNNGHSQSLQCISHFSLKCRHIFQSMQAWVFFFPVFSDVDNKKAGKRALPDAFSKIWWKLGKKKCRAQGMLASAIRRLLNCMQKPFPRQSSNLCNCKHDCRHRPQPFTDTKPRLQPAFDNTWEPVFHSWCGDTPGACMHFLTQRSQ